MTTLVPRRGRTCTAAAVVVTFVATGVENHKVGGRPLVHRDHAECATTSSIAGATNHLVDTVLAGIDCAGKPVTAAVGTVNLDTPVRHVIAERGGWFKVDGIPSKFDKSTSRGVDIGSSDVW